MITVKHLLTTYFVFVIPTFLSGCASILDLFGSLFKFNIPENEQDDLTQLQSDWKAVGSDIQEALNKFSQTHG